MPSFLAVMCAACNHVSYDILRDKSLAWVLARGGYDAWLLDLRGESVLTASDGTECSDGEHLITIF
jgi:hypothetical protein